LEHEKALEETAMGEPLFRKKEARDNDTFRLIKSRKEANARSALWRRSHKRMISM
jgi:hypothetical protein